MYNKQLVKLAQQAVQKKKADGYAGVGAAQGGVMGASAGMQTAKTPQKSYLFNMPHGAPVGSSSAIAAMSTLRRLMRPATPAAVRRPAGLPELHVPPPRVPDPVAPAALPTLPRGADLSEIAPRYRYPYVR